MPQEAHDRFAGKGGLKGPARYGHGFTVVLITHDVAEAVALADRIVVLRHGEIALDAAVGLPRPRCGTAEAAELARYILAAV